MTGLHLRPMRWWHVEAAARLESLLFAADAWRPEAFWAELAQQDSRHYVVAERGEEVAGYAGLLAVPGGPDADVLTLAVAPAAQGQGIGGRLLRDLLDEATARRCTTVYLEVRASNEPALALYRGYGFEQAGVRRGYYADGDDALVMRRREEPK